MITSFRAPSSRGSGRSLARRSAAGSLWSEGGGEAQHEEEENEIVEEAIAAARRQRIMVGVAMAGLLITWVVMSYIIFVYGMVVYTLLGMQAENAFSQTWGVSYLMQLASEWQDILTECGKTILILLVLDRLRVISDAKWFENHLDVVSIQATLFTGARTNWLERTRTFVKFTSRIG